MLKGCPLFYFSFEDPDQSQILQLVTPTFKFSSLTTSPRLVCVSFRTSRFPALSLLLLQGTRKICCWGKAPSSAQTNRQTDRQTDTAAATTFKVHYSSLHLVSFRPIRRIQGTESRYEKVPGTQIHQGTRFPVSDDDDDFNSSSFSLRGSNPSASWLEKSSKFSLLPSSSCLPTCPSHRHSVRS